MNAQDLCLHNTMPRSGISHFPMRDMQVRVEMIARHNGVSDIGSKVGSRKGKHHR